MKKTVFHLLAAALLCACSGQPDSSSSVSSQLPSIFPDYTDVVIPRNIAPANFIIDNEADAYFTVLSNGSTDVKVKGRKVQIALKAWKRLTSQDGNTISIQVYTKRNGRWTAMSPFSMTLSDDPIDRYITYRTVPLSIEASEILDMHERDITNFKDRIYYSNTMIQDNVHGSCANCHQYCNYSPDKMQFHVRMFKGGTVLYYDGKLHKVNMKTDSTISAGVYPSWHPTHDYIAYSNDKTHQMIHSMGHDKIEVLEEESDIILYNIRENAVSPIENDSSELEVFPAWSADGRTLYYVSAHYEAPFGPERKYQIFEDRFKLHFNLYAKPFDPDTRTWGPHYLVYDAAAADSSMTWPRLSPDGRYLLACISPYGVFPIDQSVSDLFLLDFKTGAARSIEELNSPYTESYHVWSSNSKWIMWSTRREDGVYTRLYFSHVDENGHFSKPFALPQKDPEFNRKFLYAFNIPEFMTGPVQISAKELASFVKDNEAVPSAFESKREKNEKGEIITTDYRVDGKTGASMLQDAGLEGNYLH